MMTNFNNKKKLIMMTSPLTRSELELIWVSMSITCCCYDFVDINKFEFKSNLSI